MDFEEAVASAPAGWRHFRIEDLSRLAPAVRRREMARIPPDEPDDHVLKALFWTLVYHLEPERWDALSRAEPIAPELIAALPSDVEVALDVGAGSGRLTKHLVERSRRVIAIEPSAGLRALLARRLPEVDVMSGWAERLPLRDGAAQLTAACGAFGPDPIVIDEMRRVTAPGGRIALISPERPEWFEAQGWKRVTAPRPPVPPHQSELDEFFGPPDPPHEMVTTTV